MRVTPTVFAAPEQIGAGARRTGSPTGWRPADRVPRSCSAARVAAAHTARIVRWSNRCGAESWTSATWSSWMMDEYVEDGRRCGRPDRSPQLCQVRPRGGSSPLNAPAGARSSGIAANHFWCPIRAGPGATTTGCARLGGIDLFILASGASDGHIAFNQPRNAARRREPTWSRCPESTRRDNLDTFPTFGHDLDRRAPAGRHGGGGHDLRPIQGGRHGRPRGHTRRPRSRASRPPNATNRTGRPRSSPSVPTPSCSSSESAIDDSVRHHYEISPAAAEFEAEETNGPHQDRVPGRRLVRAPGTMASGLHHGSGVRRIGTSC